MSGKTGGEKETGREPVSVTVTLPAALVDQLKEFCRNCRVTRDMVVERAGRIFPRRRHEPLSASPFGCAASEAGLRSWLAVR